MQPNGKINVEKTPTTSNENNIAFESIQSRYTQMRETHNDNEWRALNNTAKQIAKPSKKQKTVSVCVYLECMIMLSFFNLS